MVAQHQQCVTATLPFRSESLCMATAALSASRSVRANTEGAAAALCPIVWTAVLKTYFTDTAYRLSHEPQISILFEVAIEVTICPLQ